MQNTPQVNISDQNQNLSKKERREMERMEREKEKNKEEKKGKMKKIFWVVGISIVVIGIVVLVFFGRGGQNNSVGNTLPDPYKGSETAPVVVAEYSDFQCPACASAAPIVEEVIGEFGDKIKFVYNDFPLSQHKFAEEAAIAGQCAYEQGKFWEYHDKLFDTQNIWSKFASEQEAVDFFNNIVNELNLDSAAFQTCRQNPEITKRIKEDEQEGRSLGLNGTPTFYVNGKEISGRPLGQALRAAIDEAL